MYKETKQNAVDMKSLEDRRLDYYELAVYFAAAKSQENGFRWDDFIDNLSIICDKFATHIKSNGKTRLGL